MQIEVVYTGQLLPSDGEVLTEAAIEGAFNGTMEELLKLDDVADPSVSGSLTSGHMEITCLVESDAEPEDLPLKALQAADTAIRTALHAAGVGTPGWRFQWQETRVGDLIDA